MDWNDETIGRIRALWAEGHSTAEIGRRMGITKNAVVGKAHRLSLPPRPSPIRRVPGEGSMARRPARRMSGPTLPAMAAAPLQRPETPRTQPAPIQAARSVPVQADSRAEPAARPALLRTVPAQPRPTGRLSPCCWPLGEPGTPSFRFCGDPAIPTKPYCAEHASLAYVRVRDRREDAA